MIGSRSTGAERDDDEAQAPRGERLARVKRRDHPGEVSFPWSRQPGEAVFFFARTSFELPDLGPEHAVVAAATPAVEGQSCSRAPRPTPPVDCGEEDVFDAFFHGPSLSPRRLCLFATILGALR
jgi:hypothetical protein